MPPVKPQADAAQEPQAPDANDRIAALEAKLAEALQLLRDRTPAPVPQQSADMSAIQLLAEMLQGKSVKQRVDEAAARIQEIYAAQEAARAELESGPKRWEVSMENEPRMTVVVGATNEGEAVLKYHRWFGIRSPGNKISTTLVA